MGSSITAAELAGKLNAAAASMQNAQHDAVKKASMVTKKTIEASLTQVVPSGRLRNVGKNGAKLSVGFKQSGNSSLVSARGAWPIIESDIGAHLIGGKKKSKRLRLPDGGVRRTVIHPGTKGKHPFRKGVAKSIKPATDALVTTVADTVFATFK